MKIRDLFRRISYNPPPEIQGKWKPYIGTMPLPPEYSQKEKLIEEIRKLRHEIISLKEAIRIAGGVNG